MVDALSLELGNFQQSIQVAAWPSDDPKVWGAFQVLTLDNRFSRESNVLAIEFVWLGSMSIWAILENSSSSVMMHSSSSVMNYSFCCIAIQLKEVELLKTWNCSQLRCLGRCGQVQQPPVQLLQWLLGREWPPMPPEISSEGWYGSCTNKKKLWLVKLGVVFTFDAQHFDSWLAKSRNCNIEQKYL